MPLLQDLIDIPERVHQGDFVLRLTEGIQHAEQTLRDYVVTRQLAASFDASLKMLVSAVQFRPWPPLPSSFSQHPVGRSQWLVDPRHP